MKKIFIFIPIFFLTGCAVTKGYRASPVFEGYFDSKRTVAVVPLDIKIYQLTAGGIDELMDEWSEDSKLKTLNSIREELSSLPSIKLSFIEAERLGERDKDFIKEQNGLYKAVAASIIWHTYAPKSIFKHKLNNFDYTLGPDITYLSVMGECDTLLFCTGRNYIWTAGRTSLAIFGALLGVVTGTYYYLPSGPEFIAVSLVDAKTGDVIWFNYVPMQGDLRDEEICKKNIKKLFSSFLNREI